MEAARTSEMSVDNYFTRQYIPEDESEPHTRRHKNLKSHLKKDVLSNYNFFVAQRFIMRSFIKLYLPMALLLTQGHFAAQNSHEHTKEFLRKLSTIWTCALKKVRQP
jgi:hypothetical protein